MKFFLLIGIIPAITFAVTPHRQTISRRIERISGYMIDTRTRLETSDAILSGKLKLFSRLGCDPSMDTTDLDTSMKWARNMHDEMHREGFVDSWASIAPGRKVLYCIVLHQSIENQSKKMERRARSMESLQVLRDEYERLLSEFDLAGVVNPRWEHGLVLAEKYERYDRGIKSVSIELHKFLAATEPLEYIGEMFWDPSTTVDVLREIIDSIMREEDDVMKLRICLEMVHKSNTLKKWNLHEMVKQIVDEYRDEYTNIGNDLLNTEKFLLGGE